MCWGRSKEIKFQFQAWFWFSSTTFNSLSTKGRGPSISSLKVIPFIHLSCQTLALSPLPILHPMPSENVENPSLIACQFGDEGNLSGSYDLLLETTQYLFKITFAHKESFSWNILQFNFSKKAMFFPLAAFIPSPPSSLDFIILFHLTGWIFLFSFVIPHRKFRLTLSIFDLSLSNFNEAKVIFFYNNKWWLGGVLFLV